MQKKWLWKVGIATGGISALVIAGILWYVDRALDDCNTVFVSDRPDLTHGGTEWWAKAHAADFIPTQKARDLKIAITQGCMSPAPETLIAQFSLSAQDLRDYLHGKTLRSDGVESIVASEEMHGLNYHNDTYNRLSWWPPRQSLTLKTYSAQDRSGINFHLFVNTQTRILTVIAPASRGR